MNYIDPTTWLPVYLGELYSNNNLRLMGSVRINPLNATQIDTLNLSMICSPLDGGNAAVANIPDGTYDLSDVGSTLWLEIPRTGTVTASPDPYVNGVQPRPRKNYVQIAYRSLNGVVMFGGFLIQTTRFQVLGALQPAPYFIVGSVSNADFPTLWAALASPLIVQGSHIVVVSNQTMTTPQTLGSVDDIIIEFAPNVTLSSTVGFPDTSLTISNRVETRNFHLDLLSTSNGILISAVESLHKNLWITVTGIIDTVLTLGLGASATQIDGKIDGIGTFATEVLDSSGLYNHWNFVTSMAEVNSIGRRQDGMYSVEGFARIDAKDAITKLPTPPSLTQTFDCSKQHIFYIDGGGASFVLANLTEGQTVVISVASTGAAYVITWDAAIIWGPLGIPEPTALASKYDLYTFMKIGGSTYGTVLLCMGTDP